VIEARGLRRDFRPRARRGTIVHAVRDVTLDVVPGEIVGFLGPNGAGKTTTMRMLTTLLRPTAGEATLAGCDLINDPAGVRRRIGYVAQGVSTSPDNTVGEELMMQARLHGLSKHDARRQHANLADQFDLDSLGARVIRTLSGGQRRRLDIALALIHRPALLLLDEPTTGLDPHNRGNLWDHIRRLREESGVTVFLCTHYLDEADSLADRIFVMDHGEIVARGTPDGLRREIAPGEVISVDVPAEDIAETARIAERLSGASAVIVTDSTVTLRVPRGETALPGLLRTLDIAGIPAVSLRSSRATLDDVFLAVTGRSLRDTGGNGVA